MDDLTKLSMPVALPIWGLASLKIDGSELRNLLGEPHFVETNPRVTCGGEEDAWAYILPSGQRALIILDVTIRVVEIFGDPPQIGPILDAFRLAPDDPRLEIHPEPVEML